MTASSFGPKNEPIFSDSSAPDVAVNPTQVAAYAAKVGNRRVGTTAERDAATGKEVWERLIWSDTTTGADYMRIGTGWVPLAGNLYAAVKKGTAQTLTNAGTNYIIQWETAISNLFGMHDGSTAAPSRRLTAPAAGVYRVTANVWFNQASGYATTKIFKNGVTEFPEATDRTPGVSGGGAATKTSTLIVLAANDYVEVFVSSTVAGVVLDPATEIQHTFSLEYVGRA